MLTVEPSSVSVEQRLASGGLWCPASGCGRVLARWGYARERRLRGPGERLVRLRPRRARCRGCGVTQVLLPVTALAWRADLAEVIGAALAAKAAGAEFRVAEAVPGAAITVVRLRAPLPVLHARIRSREAGDPGWFLGAATHTANVLEQASVEDHLVDNQDRPVAAVAVEVLRRAGWLHPSPRA